uniref:DNA topoisomerase n=1 Tax=viral metagenome TaxID=1070528 RepID=A0A6C0CAL2_9ZZZZ
MSTLVVVESAGKIKSFKSYLGGGHTVMACKGIFQDLDPKKLSVDVDNNFNPIYVITDTQVVANLKAAMKKADMLYIASDADREGEKIADSLKNVLKPKKYKRLIFRSINKKAVLDAVKTPGDIDYDMVNSQKGRRVLDKIVGWEVSEVLGRALGMGLSAGRVQSPTTKLIVEREEKIMDFLEKNKDSTFYKVHGTFSDLKSTMYTAAKHVSGQYDGKIAQVVVDEDDKSVMDVLDKCLKSTFMVHDVTCKNTTRNPAPPFETATLQQEAARKLKMSIKTTMSIAQKLYEGGYITYMRTDSVEIPEDTMNAIKKVVEQEYGAEYYQRHVYKNKNANAQEAHSAILPVKPDIIDLDDYVDEQLQINLYKLIWQRSIASQMKPAKIDITTIQIDISEYAKINPFYYFQSQIEKVVFQGFMIVYIESQDDVEKTDMISDHKGKLPKINDVLAMKEIIAKQEFLKPPPRFAESSLISKMKELGMGRPATYAAIFNKIVTRKYIEVANVPGIKKKIKTFTITCKDKNVKKKESEILIGNDKNKLVPTELGKKVTAFLEEHFSKMMDYKFTAKMEKDLDDIAHGKKIWQDVVRTFYQYMHPVVIELSKMKAIKPDGRSLGVDPSGIEIIASQNRKGNAYVKKLVDGKYVYASICAPLKLETIKLKDALKLFEYPKLLGKYDKEEVFLKKYEDKIFIAHGKKTYSVPQNEDIDLQAAIIIIDAKKSNIITEFKVLRGTATVLKGNYGSPYINFVVGKKRTNFRLPYGSVADGLTKEDVIAIISAKPNGGSKTAKK